MPCGAEEWSRGTRGRGLCAPGGSAGVSSTPRGLPGAAALGQLLSALPQAPGQITKGEQVRRVYDVAQTPLQRLLASGVLPEDRRRALRERVQQIDPLALSEHLDALRHALLYGAHLPPLVSADGRAWPQLRFSLAACTSVPRPPSEEEPEQTDYQEAPSSSEDILSWLHTPHGPFAGVWEEILSLLQAHPEWTSTQILQEKGDPPESRPTELHRPEAAVSAVEQYAAQAQPLPAAAPGTPSSPAGEHEDGHLTPTTGEQAIAAYVQEMRAAGRDPKTLQWHQTSLGALRRYLWMQFHLTDVCELTRDCLQSWVTDLPIALSARTGVTRTDSAIGRSVSQLSRPS